MAIRKKLIAGVVKASSTHYRNLDNAPAEKSDTTLVNQDDRYKLYDPDELEGGRTHKSNLTAAVDDALPNDSVNVGTIDNDIDPAENYLEDGDQLITPGAPAGTLEAADDPEDEDDGDWEDENGEPIEAVDDGVDEALESEDDFEDEDEEEEEWEDDPQPEDFDLEDTESDEEDEEMEAEMEELPVGNADSMDIVDVDEIPENETEDVIFASVGSKVLVLKGDRVIASMGKKGAVRAAAEGIYQTPQFHEAAYQETQRHGLRAGLKSMGFSMSRINVAGTSVINKRVEARVSAMTAAVRKTADNKQQNFAQCLAIASVGISRRFFKDSSNELAASLTANLQRAGVRDAQRIINAAFAKHGVSYAKSIITIAQRLQDMPEEHRSQFADALDMLDEDGEFLDADAVFEDEDTSDFVDATADDLEDFVPESITAALSRPGQQHRGALLQNNVGLTASAILSSDEPLQFI